jgi:hypothetical protein
MTKACTHEEIARLAYELWEPGVIPLGSPEIDWHAAVRDSREQFYLNLSMEPEEGSYRRP